MLRPNGNDLVLMVNWPLNWFDLVVVFVLLLGLQRGRKRGMSEEVLTFLQWVVTLFVCAFTYRLLGDVLAAQFKFFGKLSAYITSYILIAAVIAGVFLGFKRAFHGKLIGSDTFGKAEYYLGMPAGMIRFLCVLLCGLALLNARLYTREELEASRKFAMDNYGKEYFPGLRELQSSVLEQSFTGPHIKKFLRPLLIEPTKSQGAQQFRQKEWNPTP